MRSRAANAPEGTSFPRVFVFFGGGAFMRNIEIDFAEPFEKVLATVLSLPPGCSNAVGSRSTREAEIKEVIRGLYAGANGQRVKTKIGSIMIAPPACPFLKAKPFSVTPQIDLLIEAATRIIAGPALPNGRRRQRKGSTGTSVRHRHPAHASETNDFAGASNTPLRFELSERRAFLPYKCRG
jgi:hypothetical protein